MTDSTAPVAGELKPCPFCGQATASVDCMGDDKWDVECQCGAGILALGPTAKKETGAVNAWNRRATPTPATELDGNITTANWSTIDDILSCFASYGDHDDHALQMVLDQHVSAHRDVISELREALKPFADYKTKGAPQDHFITQGSPFAQRQLMVADCEKARMAIARASDVLGEKG